MYTTCTTYNAPISLLKDLIVGSDESDYYWDDVDVTSNINHFIWENCLHYQSILKDEM